MVEGGEDKALLDLFTKHSHHQKKRRVVLCQNMFPLEKYAKNISRHAHLLYLRLLKSKISISDEEFTVSSFFHLLARHYGRVSKSDRKSV